MTPVVDAIKPAAMGAVQAKAERLVWPVPGGTKGYDFYMMPECLPLPFLDKQLYRLDNMHRTKDGYILNFIMEGKARPFLDPGMLVSFRPNDETDVSVYFVSSVTWSAYEWTKGTHLCIHLHEQEQSK